MRSRCRSVHAFELDDQTFTDSEGREVLQRQTRKSSRCKEANPLLVIFNMYLFLCILLSFSHQKFGIVSFSHQIVGDVPFSHQNKFVVSDFHSIDGLFKAKCGN